MVLTPAIAEGSTGSCLSAQIAASAPVEKTIWLDNPANLYRDDLQADAYLSLMNFAPYGNGFHATVRSLIERHASDLLAGLGESIEFIDLGPGYPDKSFPILRQMQRSGTEGRYRPVDISRRFLDLAADACRGYGFPVSPTHMLFEDLPELLHSSPSRAARLIMMGVTFLNYESNAGTALLARMLCSRDAAVIAGELLDPGAPPESLIAPYASEKAKLFNLLPLRLAGVACEHLQYFVRFRNRRIEMGFHVTAPVPFRDTCLFPGQELVTAFSYRYTYHQLEAVLRSRFPHVELFCDDRGSCVVARVRL
jgi:hypothetical protein